MFGKEMLPKKKERKKEMWVLHNGSTDGYIESRPVDTGGGQGALPPIIH